MNNKRFVIIFMSFSCFIALHAMEEGNSSTIPTGELKKYQFEEHAEIAKSTHYLDMPRFADKIQGLITQVNDIPALKKQMAYAKELNIPIDMMGDLVKHLPLPLLPKDKICTIDSKTTLPIDALLAYLAISSDGKIAALTKCDERQLIYLFDFENGKLITKKKSNDIVYGLALNNDGSKCLMHMRLSDPYDHSEKLELWDISNNASKIVAQETDMGNFCFSNDGTLVAYETPKKKKIKVINRVAKNIRAIRQKEDQSYHRIAISENNKLLFAVEQYADKATASVYDIATKICLQKFKLQGSASSTPAISNDGKFYALSRWDYSQDIPFVDIFDQSGIRIQQLSGLMPAEIRFTHKNELQLFGNKNIPENVFFVHGALGRKLQIEKPKNTTLFFETIPTHDAAWQQMSLAQFTLALVAMNKKLAIKGDPELEAEVDKLPEKIKEAIAKKQNPS